MSESLSPGEMWKAKLRLKDMSEACGWRRYWLKKAEANSRIRSRLREECSRDILLYINLFGWTYDPRRKVKSIPWITYPYQDKGLHRILRSIERGTDLVIDKSRDMGASWMCLAAMEFCWHWHRGMSFLMMSRNEKLVDKSGDLDALFPKIDFFHQHLPEWLWPDGYDPGKDRIKCHFGNSKLNSSIDGESTTSASGVGGRRTGVFLDEFSRMENAYEIMQGVADVTRCRIYNFTPWGSANAAYKMAQRAMKGEVGHLRLHWTEHPRKAAGMYRWREDWKRIEFLDPGYPYRGDYCYLDEETGEQQPYILDGKTRSPEYDFEWRRRNNPREMAEQWDVDYQGSSYLFFDRAMIQNLQHEYGEEPWLECDLVYDEDSGEPYRLTPVPGGPIKLWCRLDHENRPPAGPYGGGTDLAAGTGATNSCFALANRQTGEKVLELADPFVKPEKLAPRVVALCRLFKDVDGRPAKLAWEQQGPGLVFGKGVISLGYRNVYFKTNEGKMYGGEDIETPGWYPSDANREILLTEYRADLSSRSFLNRSVRALEECNFFIRNARGVVEHSQAETGYSELTGEQDPSGARANHGDRVIADALCAKMCRESGQSGQRVRQKEQQQAAREPSVMSIAGRRALAARKSQDEENRWQ